MYADRERERERLEPVPQIYQYKKCSDLKIRKKIKKNN